MDEMVKALNKHGEETGVIIEKLEANLGGTRVGKPLKDMTLAEMDKLWDEAKRVLKN